MVLGGFLGKKWWIKETSAKAEPISKLAPSTFLEKEDVRLLILHGTGRGEGCKRKVEDETNGLSRLIHR